MKKSTMTIALAAALLSISTAYASEFSGGWIGGKVGSNSSDIVGAATAALPTVNAKKSDTYGFEAGYNWDMSGFLLGVDGFADFNQKATHVAAPAGTVNYGSDVYGLDVKLGLPSGNWLPYAKLGYGSSRATGAVAHSANGAHLGLGVEYKFAPHWSVAGEYTTISGNNAGQKLNNDNLTIGINYYFDSPYVAPAVAAVAVPVVVKQEPAPVVAPKVAPVSETWKTLLEEKPVTLKGTNFDFDSAKLRPAADAKLNEVAEFAAAYPDAKLDVSGHTCSLGSDAYNQKLSERRAASVKAYLVNKGVAADRIVSEGYGETKPVADNKTKAGREENRRVEIRSVIKEQTRVRVIQ